MPVISSYPVSGICVSSFVRNILAPDYAFLALGSAGMQILNVTNSGSPVSAGTYSATGLTNEIYVSIIDSIPYAFLATGTGGLVVLNVSNIGRP